MSSKYFLFWMMLFLLDLTVCGGIPSLRRRRRDDAAKTEHSLLHSDQFLASFLSTIPDSEGDSIIKKAAPTTVSEPVPLPRDITNEIEARTDIVTGFAAIAGVVSSAVGQFLSFLVRKKLVLAAVVAAIFASFGISKVVTDDFIGVAENISGQRIERQFSDSSDPAGVVQQESFISQLLQLFDLASWFESADVKSTSLVSSGNDGDPVLPAADTASDLSTITTDDAVPGFQLFDLFNEAAWFGTDTGDDGEAVTSEDVAQELLSQEVTSTDTQSSSSPRSQTVAGVRTIPSPGFINLPLVQDQDVGRSEALELNEDTKVLDAVLQAANSQIATKILSESSEPILKWLQVQASLNPSSVTPGSVSLLGNQDEGQSELKDDVPNKSMESAAVQDPSAIDVDDLVSGPVSATLSMQLSTATDSSSLLKLDTVFIPIPKHGLNEDIKSNPENEAHFVPGSEDEEESFFKVGTVDTVSIVDQSNDESIRDGKEGSMTEEEAKQFFETELVQENMEVEIIKGSDKVASEVEVLTGDQSCEGRVDDNPPQSCDINLQNGHLLKEVVVLDKDINEELEIEKLPQLDNIPIQNQNLLFRSFEEPFASVDTSFTYIDIKSDPVASKLLSSVVREGKVVDINEEESVVVKEDENETDGTVTEGYKDLVSTLRSVELEFGLQSDSKPSEDFKDWKGAVFVNEEIADDQQII